MMGQDIFHEIKIHGQEHLTEHYDRIADKHKQAAFLQQLKSVDYDQANQLYQQVYVEKQALKDNEKQ